MARLDPMSKPRAGRSSVDVTHVGAHFALGRTRDIGGIWTKDAVARRRPGPPIESFPLTEEGGQAAWARFSTWEPNAQPVEYQHLTRPGGRAVYWVLATAVVLVIGGVAGAAIAARRSPTRHNTSAPRSTARSKQLIGTPDPTASAPVGTGYLAIGNGFVDYIQWTNNGGQLSGSAQAVSVSGQPPSLTTATQTLTVAGTLQGPTLSITFDGGAATFGTLSGKSFTLDFPQKDGSLAPVPFQAAAATAFNGALSDLNQRVTQANTQEANAQALQQQQQTIDSDVARVSADLASLPSTQSTMTSDVQAATAGDLQGEAKDLASTQTDQRNVVAEAMQYPGGNTGSVCVDANAVGVDANGVAVDANSVSVDVNGVVNDLSSTRSAVAALTSDFAQLQSDEASLPSYQPANVPTPDKVLHATANANSAIASTITSTNADIDTANGDVGTAYQYADAAMQAGNCGTTSESFTPMTHIS